MDLAIVIGSVVATRKDPSFEGVKLAILQPVNDELKAQGTPFIAVDADSQCGNGQVVYWVGGGDACNLGIGPVTPADAAIVGLVDEGSIHSRTDCKTVSGGLFHFRKEELDREG